MDRFEWSITELKKDMLESGFRENVIEDVIESVSLVTQILKLTYQEECNDG